MKWTQTQQGPILKPSLLKWTFLVKYWEKWTAIAGIKQTHTEKRPKPSEDDPKSSEKSMNSSEDDSKRYGFPQMNRNLSKMAGLQKISQNDPKPFRRFPKMTQRAVDDVPKVSQDFRSWPEVKNTTTDAPWAISEWLLTPSASRLFHKQNLMLSDWYIQWSDRRIAAIHVPCDRYFRCKMFPQRLHVETSL